MVLTSLSNIWHGQGLMWSIRGGCRNMESPSPWTEHTPPSCWRRPNRVVFCHTHRTVQMTWLDLQLSCGGLFMITILWWPSIMIPLQTSFQLDLVNTNFHIRGDIKRVGKNWKSSSQEPSGVQARWRDFVWWPMRSLQWWDLPKWIQRRTWI